MYDEDIEWTNDSENDIYQAFKDFITLKRFREFLGDALDEMLWDDDTPTEK